MNSQRIFSAAQTAHRTGQLVKAKSLYEKAIAVDANFGMAQLFLAVIEQQLGNGPKALGLARQAMDNIDKPDAAVWVNYGVILKNARLFEEAKSAYAQALELKPDMLSVKANLATLHLHTDNTPDAERLCLELIGKFEDVGPYLNLVRINMNKAEPELDLVAQYLQAAQDINPKHPDLAFLQGALHAREGDDKKAFENLVQALKVNPVHGQSWELLLTLEPEDTNTKAIADVVQKLLALRIQDARTLCMALTFSRKHLLLECVRGLEEQVSSALEQVQHFDPHTATVFNALSFDIPQSAHLKIAQSWWQGVVKAITDPLPPPELRPLRAGKKPRVAFLSSDLRQHAVAINMVGFFEALPHDQLEWFVFSNAFDDESSLRQRIRQSVDRFINIASLSHLEVAQLVRSNEVDILIDLNNVTSATRIAVLAYRAAPIQLTMVGAPGSIGAKREIDYIVLGEYAVDHHNRDGFAEHVVEGDFFTHDPIVPNYDLAQSKSDHGLPCEAFVFCCFNNHYKLSPGSFALWQQILSQVENSVLWLVKPSESVLSEFTLALGRCGIDKSRVVFAPMVAWNKHVARLKHADLVLDTLPYGAHTTSADALRAGVPVLTMPGRTYAGRGAQYLLNRCGLQEWVVDSAQAYVSKAVAFAQQSRRVIQDHKDHVFSAYWASALVDGPQAAQRFERLCLELLRRKRAGEPNEDFRLTNTGQFEPVDYSQEGQLRG